MQRLWKFFKNQYPWIGVSINGISAAYAIIRELFQGIYNYIETTVSENG